MQVTATLVTLAEPTVPVPLPTVQVWPEGWVITVTAYAAAACEFRREGKGAVRGDGQVVAAVILQHYRAGQPRDRPADRIRHGRVSVQVTATLVTFAEPTVPVPLPTVQVWPDGWVFTVTA